MWGLIWCGLSCPVIAAPETIYLFRHAEKTGGDNPNLTAQGRKRAALLATLISATEQPVTVLSSDYKRTKQTALAIAKQFNTSVQIYDASDLNDLIGKISTLQHSVVVVGHSNTTPAIAAMLSGTVVAPMAEDNFSQYYILHQRALAKSPSYDVVSRTMVMN